LSRTAKLKGLKDWIEGLETRWKIDFPYLVQRSLTKFYSTLSNTSWL